MGWEDWDRGLSEDVRLCSCIHATGSVEDWLEVKNSLLCRQGGGHSLNCETDRLRVNPALAGPG